LGAEEGSVLIAIDNPHDLQRVGEIKSLFPGQKLKFCVALKQDILDYIKLFMGMDPFNFADAIIKIFSGNLDLMQVRKVCIK